MSTSAFGQRLRDWRKTRDLTQTRLAMLAGYAVSTIRKLEGSTLRPSRHMAQRLAEVLEVPEYERTSFVQLARALPVPKLRDDPSATDETQGQGTGAAPLTGGLMPLIGREGDLQTAVQTLLTPYVRLLTLTGPGGVGKTRLGLAVAAALRPHFPAGVTVVSLGDIHDSALVAGTITHALGLQPFTAQSSDDQLLALLKNQHLLLLLDTCEHLAVAPLIDALLTAASGVKVLVTSRMTLGLPVEYVQSVQPLTNPPPNAAPTLATLQAYPATALFLSRMRVIHQDVEALSEQQADVLTICRLLDGLPLALEIAAARLRHGTLHQLLADLATSFLILHDEQPTDTVRHTTLAATIDWSYHLLDPPTQRLFVHLAVFVSGWTIEAAEAVCAPDADQAPAVVDALTTLLDHSLIILQHSGDATPRYAMLDTIHEYANERCRAHAEYSQIQERHLAYFVKFAESAARHYRQANEGAWLDRLEQEHANLRVALHWARHAGNATVALHLGGLLGHFWVLRGYWREGLQLLASIMASAGSEVTPERLAAAESVLLLTTRVDNLGRVRIWALETLRLARILNNRHAEAHAHMWLGCVAHALHANDNVADEHFATSLGLYQDSGNTNGVAAVRYHQWRRAAHGGEVTRGSYYLEEGLVLDRQTGNHVALAQSLNDLGAVRAEVQSRYAEARALTEEGLALFRAAGDVRGMCYALRNLGEILVAQGELAAARVLFDEGLGMSKRYHHINGIANGHVELGIVAWIMDDLTLAQQHFEASLRLVSANDNPWGMGEALLCLGHVAYRQAERPAAREFYTNSLSNYRRRQLLVHMLIPLMGLAWCQAPDNPTWAARVLGSVEVVLESPDARMGWYASDRIVVAEIRAYLEATLTASVQVAARKDGQATPLMQMIDEAMR